MCNNNNKTIPTRWVIKSGRISDSTDTHTLSTWPAAVFAVVAVGAIVNYWWPPERSTTDERASIWHHRRNNRRVCVFVCLFERSVSFVDKMDRRPLAYTTHHQQHHHRSTSKTKADINLWVRLCDCADFFLSAFFFVHDKQERDVWVFLGLVKFYDVWNMYDWLFEGNSD